MSATDTDSISPRPRWRPRILPWRLELFLSALFVLLAGYWAPVRPRDPDLFIAGARLWFALQCFFLWMTGLRILRDVSTIPSAGEILGFAPALFWLFLLWASFITPHAQLVLPLIVAGGPIYFVTSLASCVFLLATIVGKRQHFLYKFIDILGLLVNIGSAVLLVVDLVLHPFFI